MNIMELGALGEMVGAIAVVFTLVYLAIQVRHSKEALDANTRSLEAERRLARAAALDEHDRAFNDFYRLVVENPEVADIIRRASRNEALTPVEETRYRAWLNIALRTNQASYQRAEAIGHTGLLDYLPSVMGETLAGVPSRFLDVWELRMKPRAEALGMTAYIDAMGREIAKARGTGTLET